MDFFNLNNGKDDGHNPCVHLADGNLWFNLEIGQVVVLFKTFAELQRFCSFLESAETTTEYLESNSRFELLALEEADEGSRNLCIFDGALSIVFNLRIETLLGLARYLRQQKAEDHYNLKSIKVE